MADPTCRDCGKEHLVWGKTKAGKSVLMELRQHWIVCPKRQKVEDPPVVLALLGLGYKVMESREAAKGLRGTDESKVTQALKRLEGGR